MNAYQSRQRICLKNGVSSKLRTESRVSRGIQTQALLSVQRTDSNVEKRVGSGPVLGLNHPQLMHQRVHRPFLQAQEVLLHPDPPVSSMVLVLLLDLVLISMHFLQVGSKQHLLIMKPFTTTTHQGAHNGQGRQWQLISHPRPHQNQRQMSSGYKISSQVSRKTQHPLKRQRQPLPNLLTSRKRRRKQRVKSGRVCPKRSKRSYTKLL